jgi:hypothetical protein
MFEVSRCEVSNIDCILLRLDIFMQPFIGDVKTLPDRPAIGSINRPLPTENAGRTTFLRIFLQQHFRSRQESIQY